MDPSPAPLRVDTETIVSDPTTRYFLIKSYNHDNIGRSLQHGVWATSQRNERVLGGAYESAAFVVLVFSVNHSSRFSGFGVMTSSPGESASEGRHVFCGPDGTPFPGRMFGVHWVTNCDVFFRDCEHILNSFNENKPAKVGRDGQEIDPVAGRQLCLLIDTHQPAHNRPAPLSLEPSPLSVEHPEDEEEARLPPTITSTSNGGIKPLSRSASTETSSPSKLVQQLAAVAKFLKQPSCGNINSTTSNVVDPQMTPPFVIPKVPTIDWDFSWVQNCIEANPILAIFPLDLTQIPDYESYLQVFKASTDQWNAIQKKYPPEGLPQLPIAAYIPPDFGKSFNAEVLLELLARSASQDDVDAFLSRLRPVIVKQEKDDHEKFLPDQHSTINYVNPVPTETIEACDTLTKEIATLGTGGGGSQDDPSISPPSPRKTLSISPSEYDEGKDNKITGCRRSRRSLSPNNRQPEGRRLDSTSKVEDFPPSLPPSSSRQISHPATQFQSNHNKMPTFTENGTPHTRDTRRHTNRRRRIKSQSLPPLEDGRDGQRHGGGRVGGRSMTRGYAGGFGLGTTENNDEDSVDDKEWWKHAAEVTLSRSKDGPKRRRDGDIFVSTRPKHRRRGGQDRYEESYYNDVAASHGRSKKYSKPTLTRR